MYRLKDIIALIVFVFAVSNLNCQITFANGWNATTSVPNVTTAAAGSNRLLVYIITFEDDDNTNDVTSVTYGGQSMTQAVQSSTSTGGGSQSRVEIWHLNNAGITAATHTTFIPVFSISNPTTSHGYYTMAVTLAGVNQTTPVCNTGTGTRLGASTVSLTAGISVQPSELVIYATHGGDIRTHTPAAGYTESVDLNGAGGGQSSCVNFKAITTAGTENPTSTASGNQNRFVMGAVRIIPNGATCSSPLPVELINFEIKKIEKEIRISWETASELNSHYYTVLRSADAITWENIGEIKAAGFSKVPLNYSFVDYSPNIKSNYYRLQQTDFDGSFNYSHIREINIPSDADNPLTLSPNPARYEILVDGFVNGLIIINALGQDVSPLVSISPESNKSARIDVSRLQKGTYFVNSGLYFAKFIIL